MLAFDWDHDKVTTYDGEEHRSYGDLFDMLDDLPGPEFIVGEASYESFDLEKRERFRQECERRNHVLRTIRTTTTPAARHELGVEKSDENDALAIYYAVEAGWDVHEPKAPDQAMREKRESLRNARVRQRRETDSGKIGKKILSLLEEHDPEGFEEFGELLSPAVTASMTMAAMGADSRNEFESIVGLHAHGYPNVFRADALWFGWRPKHGDKSEYTLSQFRKTLRWLFHKVQELTAGKSHPETGQVDPLSTLASYVITQDREAGTLFPETGKLDPQSVPAV